MNRTPDYLRATDPDSYPGRPVATGHPDHQPVVPTAGGVPPFCTCGQVGGDGINQPLLATHLREFDPEYGHLRREGPRGALYDENLELRARIQELEQDALHVENLRLRARIKELEFEVAALNAQRDGTRAWLGDNVVARSPLAEHTNPTTVEEKARQLAQQYPEQKIVAIKELRTWSMNPELGINIGLKEAKDAADRAYAELNKTGLPPRPGSQPMRF